MKGPSDPQVVVNGTTLIDSCCNSDRKDSCTTNSDDLNNDGCGEQLESFLEDNVKIIGGIAIGFAVFEVSS